MSTQCLQLSGRRAIVTGASRGIGAEVARALAREGATVVLAARDGTALQRVVDEIQHENGTALAIPTDVSDPIAVERLVAIAVEHLGGLDGAVNNADEHHPPIPLAEVTVEQYRHTLAIGLEGIFLSLKYEIPAMLRSGGGAIVNMSSTAGLRGVGGLAGYVSAKHGLIGLTKVAALDYAAAGIRVNAIAPSAILTENLRAAGEDMQRAAAMAMPLQRIGQPSDVASAAVWLLSEQSSFITGTTLLLDGGQLAGTPPYQVKAA